MKEVEQKITETVQMRDSREGIEPEPAVDDGGLNWRDNSPRSPTLWLPSIV